MDQGAAVRRVVVAVADGLRSDMVESGALPVMSHLLGKGAWTARGCTVSPSVTSAAMTTLFTGVSPDVHGIGKEGFAIPREVHRLQPLTRLLSAASHPSSLFIPGIPAGYRWLANTLGSLAGIGMFRAAGTGAEEVLENAWVGLRSQRRGLVFMHWPDADRAGHSYGLSSWQYHEAAGRVDRALGRLWESLEGEPDSRTLLVVCSDHGGGGLRERGHDSDHPLDTTIPILLAGAGVRPGELPPARLIDLPPTILWALGVPIPAEYGGRVLTEAFEARAVAA